MFKIKSQTKIIEITHLKSKDVFLYRGTDNSLHCARYRTAKSPKHIAVDYLRKKGWFKNIVLQLAQEDTVILIQKRADVGF